MDLNSCIDSIITGVISIYVSFILLYIPSRGFPASTSGKESTSQHRRCKRCGFHPWVRKIPWRRDRLPTPVFWPGEFHGLYSSASLVAQKVKNLPAVQQTWDQSLGQEDPLEKEKATHSSILTWRIPWTEEPGRLQPIPRVRHN